MEKDLQNMQIIHQASLINENAGKNIPLRLLEDYVSRHTDIKIRGNFFGKLINGGIKSVESLFNADSGRLLRIKNIGFSSFPVINTLKELIYEKYDELNQLSYTYNPSPLLKSSTPIQSESIITTISIPTVNTNDKHPTEVFNIILSEIYSLITERINDEKYNKNNTSKKYYVKYEKLLRLWIIDGKTLDEVAKITEVSPTKLNAEVRRFITYLMEGQLTKILNWNDVNIDKSALEKMKKNCQSQMFNSIQSFSSMAVDKYGLIQLLADGDLTSAHDIQYFVPINKTGLYNSIIRSIITESCSSSYPMTAEKASDIAQKSLSHFADKHHNSNVSFNMAFIHNLLEDTSIFDKAGNGKYLIRETYLTYNNARMARIIQSSQYGLTKEEANKRFLEKYGKPFGDNFSQLKRTAGIHLLDNRYVFGEGIPSLRQFVVQYAEEKIEFSWDNFITAMAEKGIIYENSRIKTYRAYITEQCAVDQKDSKHFCHRGHIGQYPDTAWIIGHSIFKNNKNVDNSVA